MREIKNLNYSELKLLINKSLQNDSRYMRVWKITKTIFDKITKIKIESDNVKTFLDIANKYKSTITIKRDIESAQTIINYYKDNLHTTGVSKLKLVKEEDGKDYYLSIITSGIIQNPNLIYNLRNIASYFTEDFVKLDPKVYKKFENYLKSNEDVLNWFYKFISNVGYKVDESQKLLAKYIEIIYLNLSDEFKEKINEEFKKDDPDYIIKLVRIYPKIWQNFIPIIVEYAESKIKGSKEKVHDYISREILNNSVLPKSVNDIVSDFYETDRKKKKAIKNRL